MSNTKLILDGNQITELPTEIFSFILMNTSHGNGFFSLQGERCLPMASHTNILALHSAPFSRILGNPIECNCRLAWFVHHRELLRSVHGICGNGTEFANLTLHCRLCHHQCVYIEEANLCTPGSINASNVDDCRPHEICCQLKYSTIGTYLLF